MTVDAIAYDLHNIHTDSCPVDGGGVTLEETLPIMMEIILL